MNILAVGDLVGNAGIQELKKQLPKIKKEYKIDFTIVNAENSAEGMGITEKNFNDILSIAWKNVVIPIEMTNGSAYLSVSLLSISYILSYCPNQRFRLKHMLISRQIKMENVVLNAKHSK